MNKLNNNFTSLMFIYIAQTICQVLCFLGFSLCVVLLKQCPYISIKIGFCLLAILCIGLSMLVQKMFYDIRNT